MNIDQLLLYRRVPKLSPEYRKRQHVRNLVREKLRKELFKKELRRKRKNNQKKKKKRKRRRKKNLRKSTSTTSSTRRKRKTNNNNNTPTTLNVQPTDLFLDHFSKDLTEEVFVCDYCQEEFVKENEYDEHSKGCLTTFKNNIITRSIEIINENEKRINYQIKGLFVTLKCQNDECSECAIEKSRPIGFGAFNLPKIIFKYTSCQACQKKTKDFHLGFHQCEFDYEYIAEISEDEFDEVDSGKIIAREDSTYVKLKVKSGIKFVFFSIFTKELVTKFVEEIIEGDTDENNIIEEEEGEYEEEEEEEGEEGNHKNIEINQVNENVILEKVDVKTSDFSSEDVYSGEEEEYEEEEEEGEEEGEYPLDEGNGRPIEEKVLSLLYLTKRNETEKNEEEDENLTIVEMDDNYVDEKDSKSDEEPKIESDNSDYFDLSKHHTELKKICDNFNEVKKCWESVSGSIFSSDYRDETFVSWLLNFPKTVSSEISVKELDCSRSEYGEYFADDENSERIVTSSSIDDSTSEYSVIADFTDSLRLVESDENIMKGIEMKKEIDDYDSSEEDVGEKTIIESSKSEEFSVKTDPSDDSNEEDEKPNRSPSISVTPNSPRDSGFTLKKMTSRKEIFLSIPPKRVQRSVSNLEHPKIELFKDFETRKRRNSLDFQELEYRKIAKENLRKMKKDLDRRFRNRSLGEEALKPLKKGGFVVKGGKKVKVPPLRMRKLRKMKALNNKKKRTKDVKFTKVKDANVALDDKEKDVTSPKKFKIVAVEEKAVIMNPIDDGVKNNFHGKDSQASDEGKGVFVEIKKEVSASESEDGKPGKDKEKEEKDDGKDEKEKEKSKIVKVLHKLNEKRKKGVKRIGNFLERNEPRLRDILTIGMTFSVLYNICMVPYRCTFESYSPWYIRIFDVFCDICCFLFTITRILQQPKGYSSYRRLLCKNLVIMFIELIAIFPLDYFFSSPWFRINRVIQICFVGSILLFIENRLQLYFNMIYFRIFKYAFFLLIVIHFFACFWFLAAKVESEFGNFIVPDPLSPTMLYDVLLEPPSSFSLNTDHPFAYSWVHIKQYLGSLYFASFYIIGFSAPFPQDFTQSLFSVLAVVFGAGIFATIIGTVSATFYSMNKTKQLFEEKMNNITEFMKFKNVTRETRRKVMRYYSLLEKSGAAIAPPEMIFRDLDSSLNVKMNRELHHDLVSKVPIFTTCAAATSDLFYDDVCLLLRHVVVLEGSAIVRFGDIGKSMYFIGKGEVDVILSNGLKVATLKKGSFFGEISIFLSDQLRTADVVAATHCELYELTKSDVRVILQKYSECEELFAKEAGRRFEELQKKKDEEKRMRRMRRKRKRRRKKIFNNDDSANDDDMTEGSHTEGDFTETHGSSGSENTRSDKTSLVKDLDSGSTSSNSTRSRGSKSSKSSAIKETPRSRKVSNISSTSAYTNATDESSTTDPHSIGAYMPTRKELKEKRIRKKSGRRKRKRRTSDDILKLSKVKAEEKEKSGLKFSNSFEGLHSLKKDLKSQTSTSSDDSHRKDSFRSEEEEKELKEEGKPVRFPPTLKDPIFAIKRLNKRRSNTIGLVPRDDESQKSDGSDKYYKKKRRKRRRRKRRRIKTDLEPVKQKHGKFLVVPKNQPKVGNRSRKSLEEGELKKLKKEKKVLKERKREEETKKEENGSENSSI